MRCLLLATAVVAAKHGHKRKHQEKPAAAPGPKLAYMAIPGAKDETAAPRACWAAPKSWREGLVDAYGSSVVICSPEALRKNTTCACRWTAAEPLVCYNENDIGRVGELEVPLAADGFGLDERVRAPAA